jgi:hypothetical protein
LDAAESVAQQFHAQYERLAPEHGYETRQDSARPWDEVPDNNRALMIATARALLDQRIIEVPSLSKDDLCNRFRYHSPRTSDRVETHVQVRALCRSVALELRRLVPDGREQALAITKLEEVMFWANAAVAREAYPEQSEVPAETTPT